MKKPSLLKKMHQAWKRRRFKQSGMKPWTKGYEEYKAHETDGGVPPRKRRRTPLFLMSIRPNNMILTLPRARELFAAWN
jgi:hypothetical protein